MYTSSLNTVQSVSTKELTNSLLDKIFEIEQDMWARWIWEYISCWSCNTVFSKKDVFGDRGLMELPQDIRISTVMEIEKYLKLNDLNPIDELVCECWSSEMYHIYDPKVYKPLIGNRYNKEESFLSVAYNQSNEIIGFMDWYIATLEEIYEEELHFHYTEDILTELKSRYQIHRSDRLLTFSSIGTNDKNKSLLTVFALLENFFNELGQQYDDKLAIFESIIWSSTYCIFKIMWWESIDFQDRGWCDTLINRNKNYPTEVILHPNMVADYKNNFRISTKDVLLYSKNL